MVVLVVVVGGDDNGIYGVHGCWLWLMVVMLMVFLVVVVVVVDGGVGAYGDGSYGGGLSLTFQVRDKAHSVIQ